MQAFEFNGLPWKVMGGAGAVQRLPQVLGQAGLARALILSTPGRATQVQQLRSILGASAVATFTDAALHVPAAVVAQALGVARDCGADCTVSIGGGSTTGLGKRLRLDAGLPHIAIPTTYAGSEMTPIWGLTDGAVKRTGRDPRVLPVAVIYDPELLLSLPPAVAGPSALNAMAQAIANVAANPMAAVLAREAIRVLASGLPRVMAASHDLEAQADMLHGACLAGAALGLGRSGLHHRICHVLGGRYNLPHAETHAVLLPYSVAGTMRNDAGEAALVGAALGAANPAQHLHDLVQRYCGRKSLHALGLPETELGDTAAAVAAQGSADAALVLEILRGAFTGHRPGSV